jgi:type IV secretory pathway VirB3-like protein
MLTTPLFNGLTRPVLTGGLPLSVFIIVNLSWPMVLFYTGLWKVVIFCWPLSYLAAYVATISNPHFIEEFFSSRVLARPNGCSRSVGFDSLGGR